MDIFPTTKEIIGFVIAIFAAGAIVGLAIGWLILKTHL